MSRPILLGIVGDSAAGKTTIARGLGRVLGEDQLTRISADDYLRYDRRQRRQRQLSPLAPECNHLDILAQHVEHLRRGEPILKPRYSHRDGAFMAAEYVRPAQFAVVEGILGFLEPEIRDAFDVRVFLDPPEDLRRQWKIHRDCSRRGYTTDQVLEELDRREDDAERYVRPQRRHADIVISFEPGTRPDPDHLDAVVTMRPGLAHPNLSPVADQRVEAISVECTQTETTLKLAGTITPAESHAVEEALWAQMHFASHLRTERLGEFTVGTELHRSESLAVTQLVLLYQLVTASAAVAVGAVDARTDRR